MPSGPPGFCDRRKIIVKEGSFHKRSSEFVTISGKARGASVSWTKLDHSTPAPISFVRILSFGALIVAIGVLAALPFRRDSADIAPTPKHATGPKQVSRSDMLIEDDSDFHQLPSLAVNQTPTWPELAPKRDVRMPLTYEDLAVGVKPENQTEKKFVDLPKPQAVQAPSHLPPQERFSSSDFDVIDPDGTTLVDAKPSILDHSIPSDAKASSTEAELGGDATFVSSELKVQPKHRPLPKLETTPARQRQWIRQP